MSFVEIVHRAIEDVPVLARFAILMVLIVIIPQLSRRIRLPGAVGLLLSGVVLGPHMLDVFPPQHPVSQFLAELGMLLLMFFAGLEINLPLFRQKIFRSIVFGVITTSIPLLLGTLAAHWLGYGLLPAVVVGSLLASHTLLGASIVAKLGVNRLEPVVVTFGATMISDTLSLLVFAICVPLYVSGFSAAGLALQIIEILVFVPLVLFGLGRAGAYILRKVENDEETYFILMLGMIAVSALLAQYINLPGIVGTFLAGLAVNAAVKDKPAKNKLEFMGNTLFIPIFFIVTGFLINPLALLRSLTHDSILAGGIIAALVAATLAATLVAYRTFNAAGQPLLDSRMLNGVLIMVLVTSVLGPVLTQHFALLMSEPEPHRPAPATSSS
jgi:Kef-type K+ transport system membrane component KefB